MPSIKLESKNRRTFFEFVLIVAIVVSAVSCFLLMFYPDSDDSQKTVKPVPKHPSFFSSLIHTFWKFTPTSEIAGDSSHAQASSVLVAQRLSAIRFPASSAQGTPIMSSNTSKEDSSKGPAGPDASIQIGENNYDVKPNSIGSYPRYTVDPKVAIPISLRLDPNEQVDLQVVDGGQLDGKYPSLTEVADDQGQVNVNFQTQTNPGSYRVIVMRSGTRSIFDFWVGPDLPQRVSSSQ